MKEVADQLAASAPKFARDALRAMSDGDEVNFALFAATSLEHILKSYLARQHPALIVEGRSFDSLLHACGLDSVAGTPRTQIRTIGAAEALKRTTRFVLLLAPHREKLEELFEVRNGAVHLGEKGPVDTFVLPFLRASEQMREALGLDGEDYWGEYREFTSQTFEEHVAAVAIKVAALIASAKQVYAERFSGVEPDVVELVVAALAPTIWGDEEQHRTCPACKSSAIMIGSVFAEWSYEQVGDEDFIATLDATFLAETFRCPVCGLALRNADELEAAGLPLRWSIKVDPDDYVDMHEDWEPDEDYWRNR